MSLILLLLCPDWFQTYPLGEKIISFESCMTQLFAEQLLLAQGSSFCWWWPMTAKWPSESSALSGDHEAEGVCCAAGAVLGWGFSALSNSTQHCLWAPILWPECHWSLYVRHVRLIGTRLYWHLCHWPLSCIHWGADLHYRVSALTRLLWSHPTLSEEPESGREAESPPDLWFSHHCGCLLLCSLYFHKWKIC